MATLAQFVDSQTKKQMRHNYNNTGETTTIYAYSDERLCGGEEIRNSSLNAYKDSFIGHNFWR